MSRLPDRRELAEVVTEAMERWRIPGVAVGLALGDEELVDGFGVTNVAHPLPVDADTLFQVGSISKTFTATAAMRLVEQGRLALDEPARRYLPDLRLADELVARRLTMRHLVTHVSGFLGDYFADFGGGDDALGRYVASLVALPQLTPLGEVWSYNNAAFAVAGRLIEVIAGMPYELALRELVLYPLGLASATCLPARS